MTARPGAAPHIRRLAAAGLTLAVAESFTGGDVLSAITDVPGASRVLLGGIVAYADDVKRNQLRVRLRPLVEHGAVSEPVALEMAQAVRHEFRSDYGLATTGIAGPTGATAAKPVGLSIVAVAGPRSSRTNLVVHSGNRLRIKTAAVTQALDQLWLQLRTDGIL